MTLGERITLARKQAGLSQEQLGDKLGVSRQAVSKWESNQATPDVAYLAEMCRLFGVSSDWLLLGQESARENAPARCPGCQAIVTGLDKFCPNCGRPLQGQDSETYSLVLISPETLYSTYTPLETLSKLPWCSPDFPIYRKDRQELYHLIQSAPVTLMWGLSPDRAAAALSLFGDSNAAAVYRDSDGSSVEDLMASPQVPRQSLPTPAKEPMTFGATVGAVMLGIIAAALILSFL